MVMSRLHLDLAGLPIRLPLPNKKRIMSRETKSRGPSVAYNATVGKLRVGSSSILSIRQVDWLARYRRGTSSALRRVTRGTPAVSWILRSLGALKLEKDVDAGRASGD